MPKAPVELHVFHGDDLVVVASDLDDLVSVLREVGALPEGAEVTTKERFSQYDDNHLLTIMCNKKGEPDDYGDLRPVRRTCGEWARRVGRGLLGEGT